MRWTRALSHLASLSCFFCIRVNTAIVISIITPFTSTLSSLIEQVYALFFAEIVTSNAIQLLDPVGHLQRHFLAPRAKTQDAMNLLFTGTGFELAERYTNMTKIIFLTLWYCAVYPSAFFMCSFTLFINYFTDRFSLMRTWKQQPHLGTHISRINRRIFVPLAVAAQALISSYFWSGFPFDNLCQTDSSGVEGSRYVGTWVIQPLDGQRRTIVTVDDADPVYKYCLQDYFRFFGTLSFPFIPDWQPPGSEWMTEEQERLTTIYGWTAVAVLFLVAVYFCRLLLCSMSRFFVKDHYKPVGDDQNINFSDVPSISTYIPQVQSAVYAYPLLACDGIDDVDDDLLDWTDNDRPHSFYDLTRDARALLRGADLVDTKVVFSQIAHWPPRSAAASEMEEDGGEGEEEQRDEDTVDAIGGYET